jgi:hypothetical protein
MAFFTETEASRAPSGRDRHPVDRQGPLFNRLDRYEWPSLLVTGAGTTEVRVNDFYFRRSAVNA